MKMNKTINFENEQIYQKRTNLSRGWMRNDSFVHVIFNGTTTWRRLIKWLKLQDIFRKRATNYGALLRKITYKDKASYDPTPPCSTYSVHVLYCMSRVYVCMRVCVCVHVCVCVSVCLRARVQVLTGFTSFFIGPKPGHFGAKNRR